MRNRTHVAIEEPENGVQPQRVELIAKLLLSMASDRKQIVVTSHSPIFCAAAIGAARNEKRIINLCGVVSSPEGTMAKTMDLNGPLFEGDKISDLLKSDDDSGVADALMHRGAIYAL